MRRKFLSVVLCVCMMMTMAPFAFAEGETTESATTNQSSNSSGSGSGTVTPTAGITTEDALKEAISAASDNATIKLDNDITLTSTLNITKNITLNGDGHTISGSVASGSSFINVSIPNDGDFTLTNCKIVPTTQVTPNAAISLSVAGKVTVTDCTFGASNDTAGHMYNGLEFSQTVPMGDTTITGNTFYGGAFRHNCISFYKMNDNATIDITNNIFSDLNWDTTNAVRVSNYGSNTAIINLNGNTYSDHGTTGANQSYAGLLVFQKTASNNDNFTKLTVNINHFSTTSDSQLLYVYDDTTRGFSTTNQPIVKGDDTISKFIVAKIDDNLYTSLKAAVSAASAGQTVTLLKDTKEGVTVSKNLTIDLGGKTLTGLDLTNGNKKNERLAFTANNGDVTLKNGNIDGRVNAYDAGSLTIAEDVTVKNSYNNGDSYDCFGIVVWGDGTAGNENCKSPKLTVNGKVTLEKGGIAISTNGTDLSNATITINKGAVISSNEDGAIYLPSGKLIMNGGTISGPTGIQICAGSANINSEFQLNGGTVIATGDDQRTSKGTGDGLIPDGAAISVVNRGYPNGVPTVTINGGFFSSAKNDAVLAYNWSAGESSVWTDAKSKVSITGGYFTSDPTAYVASGYAAKSSDKSGYTYMVGQKTNDEVIVKPATADPTVDSSKLPDTITPDQKNAIQTSAASVNASALGSAASAVGNAITDDEATSLKEQAKNLPSGDVILYVQSFLDVTPTAYSETGKTYTLDITPKYQIVASTATTADQIELGNEGKNAEIVQSAKVLNVTEPTQVSFTLPDTFVTALNNNPTIYVKHTKSNGKTYIYSATLNGNTLTFTNPNGFSTFTVTTTAPVATVNGIGYESLQEAANAANNGDEITVNSGASHTLDFNTTKSVKVTNKTGAEMTVKFNGTDKNIDNNATETFTYTHPSSGSGSTPTTYAVNVNAATNGAVAADKKTASKGTTVTVTASPSKGYVVDAVKVVDKDGKDVAVTEKDGKYVFTMPASAVTVTGSFKAETPAPVALPFTDVKSGNWFYDAVKYAYEQGLMTGTSATTFAPNGTMNRAMIVTVLYRLEKSPAVTGASKFTDVPAGQWYSDAVAWAAANKIVNGYDETTFGPMNAVTREQMAAILFRYEQVKGLENVTLEENLNRFPDQNKISAYAIPALQWAVGQKIINGNADGTLDPTGTATRAQVAQIFTNLLNK